MYFDRFDICEAYYVYMMDYHGGQWSKEYALSGVFHRIGYKPSPLISEEGLEDNAAEILRQLVSGERQIRDRR